MSEAPGVLGLILAGGLSRRMGGGDKPLVTVGGRSILARVIERMAPQCAGLALNANGDPARFGGFGLPVVADGVAGFAGPLAGILAGLDFAAAERPGIDWVVSVAADSPFLPRDLVARLQSARRAAGADLACAASGGWSHPVIGLWPVHFRDALRHALIDEDMRKIDLWTARYTLATVEWAASPVDPFFNANTPADVTAADAIAARHPQA
jgi:molybdopterin-guanine dinucleotide biosynthesis protein A